MKYNIYISRCVKKKSLKRQNYLTAGRHEKSKIKTMQLIYLLVRESERFLLSNILLSAD